MWVNMGMFVNPDNLAFQAALNARIYVDKSGILNYMNNPVPVSLLSGDRKPQIRFLGNHHSGSGNLYHKSFRM